MNIQEILKTVKDLLDGVDIKIKVAQNELPYCYFIDGRIKTINGDGTYLVTVNEKDEILKAKEGVNLAQGDIVSIMIPNNQRSRAYIDCKKVE